MRRGITAVVAALLGGAAAAGAQEVPKGTETIALWPAGAPGALGAELGGKNNPGDVPTITVYPAPAQKATGAAFVICPGGGYGFLAVDHEGEEVARWLNDLGIAGVVLKYRLGPRYHHPAPLQDVQRAIRTVRAKAGDWGLDPKRVGILGFSAGGHLASTAATHFDDGNPDADDPVDRQGCRPDVAVLVYPVVAFASEYGHTGSIKNLLGDDPPRELVLSLSNDLMVTSRTPPTFLAHTNADAGVPAENSLLFALACRKAGVPVELHLFEKGVHGLGLGSGWAEGKIAPEPSFAAWPGLCATWLGHRGFLERPAAAP